MDVKTTVGWGCVNEPSYKLKELKVIPNITILLISRIESAIDKFYKYILSAIGKQLCVLETDEIFSGNFNNQNLADRIICALAFSSMANIDAGIKHMAEKLTAQNGTESYMCWFSTDINMTTKRIMKKYDITMEE